MAHNDGYQNILLEEESDPSTSDEEDEV